MSFLWKILVPIHGLPYLIIYKFAIFTLSITRANIDPNFFKLFHSIFHGTTHTVNATFKEGVDLVNVDFDPCK